MRRESFCQWAGSSPALLIFTLRLRRDLGDGSRFSLASRWDPPGEAPTPAPAPAPTSGLRVGEGPSTAGGGGRKGVGGYQRCYVRCKL